MKIQQWLFKILRKQSVTDGQTHGRTDGQRENSIPTTNKVCGGYKNKVCGGYNKGTTILYWFRSPKTELNPPVNGKIQILFKGFECFSSTFQGKFNFQGLFKTNLYIQVLFKSVGCWGYRQSFSYSFQPRSGYKQEFPSEMSLISSSDSHLTVPRILNYKQGAIVWIPNKSGGLFVSFDSLLPSQQFFSHVGTGLPGLNHY